MRFGKRAFRSTNNNALKSEAAYQIARAQHALGEFEDAHKKYEHAVALNPNNVMAQYGLAQIKYGLFQGENQAQQHDAIRILKMINTELMPNNVHVLYLIGSFYYHEGLLPDAKKYLNLATKADAVNSDAWIMLAIVRFPSSQSITSPHTTFREHTGTHHGGCVCSC